MESPPVDLDTQALRSLRGVGMMLALGCGAVSIAAAGAHATRDGQVAWAVALLCAAGVTLGVWWRPASPLRLVGCRWDAGGWHVTFEGLPIASTAILTGVFATRRHLLVRVRARPATGPDFDELFIVDGDRLGDARWSRLRSTLRLAMPETPPLA